MPEPRLAELTNAELFALHAQIRQELNIRGVARTANNLQGEAGEALALAVYGGVLPSTGEKSVDVIDSRRRRIQVKTRTLPQGVQRFFQFSNLDFDVALCIRFERDSSDLVWAREYTPQELEDLSSFHPSGPRLPTGRAAKNGTDVTATFQLAYNSMRNDQRLENTTSALPES